MNVKSESGIHEKSVILSFDSNGFCSSTVELAIAFAIDNQSSLHGLFVEDIDLLNLARLPFSCEISVLNAQVQTLDSQQLSRRFNSRSRHFRKHLVQQAEQSALPWGYSTARGSKINMVFQETANTKFLIIEQSDVAATQSSSKEYLPKRIVMIGKPGSRQCQALDLILKRLSGVPIELFVVHSPNEVDRQNFEMLTGKLQSHPSSKIVKIEQETLPSILSRKSNPIAYVITSRSDLKSVRQTIQQANCPLIVVS